MAFAEINPFCRKVLKKHWPEVPCFEDVRDVSAESLRERGIGRVDAVSFGFPCQDLSVAGQRAGLSGERSGLFWEACRIVDDLRPDWFIAENVPGLRSSNEGRDMAAVVGAFAELGYVGAWRSLDAQYAGLAQRRERVFFVGGLGDAGKRAVYALLEGGKRHPAPRREAGQRVAPGIEAGAYGGGNCGGSIDVATACTAHAGRYDFDSETMVLAPSLRAKANDPHRADMAAYVTGTLGAEMGRNRGIGQENETSLLVTHSLRAEGFDTSEDGTGRGTPIVPVFPIDMRNASRTTDIDEQNRQGLGCGDDGDPAPTLSQLFTPAIAFGANDDGRDADEDRCPTLRCGGVGGGGVHTAVAFAQNQRGELRTSKVAPQLTCGGGKPSEGYPAAMQGPQVRRLSPTECERLQGVSYRLPDGDWADGHSCICGRNKGRSVAPAGEEPCRCPDGPRYRALGNGVAVPVVEWLFRRILDAAYAEATQ